MKYIFSILFLTVSIYALELGNNVNLNGFTTVEAIKATPDDIVHELPTGGFETVSSEDITLDYSVFGLQLDGTLDNGLGLAVQGIVAKDFDSQDFELGLEWAYLHYDFEQDISLKLGRMKVPFLRETELRYVGYSRLWTRPQIAPSGIAGFNDYDGANFLYNTSLNEFDLQFELILGKGIHQKKEHVQEDLITMLAAKIDYEDSWLRASVGYAAYDVIIKDNNVSELDKYMYFFGLEGQIHIDDFIFNAGYSDTKTEVIPSDKMIYASIAYQLGYFTPYLLTSQKSIYFVNPIPTPPGIPQLKEEIVDEFAVGVRYDFHTNMALKVQYLKKEVTSYSPEEKLRTKESGLMSATLDMVF